MNAFIGGLAGLLLICGICGTNDAPPAIWRIAFGVLAGALFVLAPSSRK